MNDFLKWVAKTAFIGVFWVFVLSITIEGRTLFSYAHDVFIKNPLVEYVDGELADLWDKVKETARITFREVSHGEERG